MANSNPTNTFCGWLCLSGLILLMDQASKYAVERTIEYGERVEINSILNIVHMMNPGAAFSLLADAGGWQRWFFVLIAVGVSVFIVIWMQKTQRNYWWLGMGLSLILGGAIGNLYDRIFQGYVIDFISLHYQNYFFPAFNLADSAITLGAAILIIDMLFLESKRKKSEESNS